MYACPQVEFEVGASNVFGVAMSDWVDCFNIMRRASDNDRECEATVAEEMWIQHLLGYRVPRLAEYIMIQRAAEYWGPHPQKLRIRLNGAWYQVRSAGAQRCHVNAPLPLEDWARLDAILRDDDGCHQDV